MEVEKPDQGRAKLHLFLSLCDNVVLSSEGDRWIWNLDPSELFNVKSTCIHIIISTISW